jgi:hypothetical protein
MTEFSFDNYLRSRTEPTSMTTRLPHLHSSLTEPLDLTPKVSRPAKIEPYDRCWCGSEKKFKFCHHRREHKKPFNIHQVYDLHDKELQRRYCSHADATGQPCDGKIVKAHTIQKSGGLEAIARDGHVYFLSTPRRLNPERKPGELVPRLVGIGQASVFPGFCAKHDRELFLPIEGKHCTIGPAEALLFSYRTSCLEAHYKQALLAVSDCFFRFDEGAPVKNQEKSQNLAHNVRRFVRRAEADTHSQKKAYQARLEAQDFVGFAYSWTRFDGLLPVACSGAFLPDNDLMGTPLQRIPYGKKVFEAVTLNITSFAGQSIIVFGWIGANEGPAARFVQSFDALDDRIKAAAATRLALEYLENSYISPNWWEALSEPDKRSLISHDGTNGVGQRPSAITHALGRPIASVTAFVIAMGGQAARAIY